MATRKDKIIIIAGSREQFHHWLDLLSPSDNNDYINADYPSKIAGVRAQAIIEIGTAYERKDYEELKALALSRIF